jgi:DNA-3-methyladenine glycosylase I
MTTRCAWVPLNDPLYLQYHDAEWGVPVYDDRRWFEFLTLECFQAGLSWRTILYKRDNFRLAFDDFEPNIIASYADEKVTKLLANAGIIRNRLKILACISNAQSFLSIQSQFGTFNEYIWRFVDGKPIHNAWKSIAENPSRSTESDILSIDLRSRGFKFVGSTVCYAHMQATGMVNDHTTDCFRYDELRYWNPGH